MIQAGINDNLFEDDMENGTDGWWTGSCTLPERDDCSSDPYPWALTTASSHSGSYAWTDSPGGHYQNNVLAELFSPRIDLTEVSSATLTFWHRYAFARGDTGKVRVHLENGWTDPRTFTGTNSTWRQVSVDLSPFVGQSIQISFFMTTDATDTADGWYIDDVAIFSSDFAAYDACTYSVSSTSASFGPDGGNASVEVGASSGCQWTAESDSPWLRITAGRSGRGPGSVRYTVAANPNSTARTGTLTIAGETITITQTGVTPSGPAHLENPQPQSFQSGIAAISGWACEAQTITIELNGVPYRAGYPTTRPDTQGVCGDSDNGFSLLWNWNNLGPGTHTVRALLDGVEFATTTVRVTTFGEQVLRGVSGIFPLSDFPHAGDTTTVQWEESLQNFVITDGQPHTGGGYNRVAGVSAVLENPSLGSAQSGVGVISGWACEAEEIVIELNGVPYRAGYPTTRPDTQDVCGDTNNGFSLLWNWNNLGAGTHTVRALLDSVEFANTTVRVTTFGADPFPRGWSGTFPIPDFPRPGENKRLQWEESLQNFVIIP